MLVMKNGWEVHVFPSSLFRMCMCSNGCVQLHVYLYSIVCVWGGGGGLCKTILKDRVCESKVKAIELR
jgi:hypothetical protein